MVGFRTDQMNKTSKNAKRNNRRGVRGIGLGQAAFVEQPRGKPTWNMLDNETSSVMMIPPMSQNLVI